MATAVIDGASVACVYDIPDPGMGLTVDFNRVNVEFTESPGANAETIPFVPGGQTDCGAGGGWYYNDATVPTQVILCPSTCDEVQMADEGAVEVSFGCQTVVR